MIAEETHISKKMTPWQIGWFIVAINLSDIAAKGGKPLGLVLSLGLPRDTHETYLMELIKGADLCATMYESSIVGGDTKENKNLTICGTIFGTVKKDEFMSRKGAKPGDIVAVTGTLGKAGVGYYALKNKIENKKIIKGLFEPIPRIKEGIVLSSLKVITSCMDISDGLSSSLYQLQKLNNVGFEIEKENIPLNQDLIKLENMENLDIYNYGLHFGGDYELLLTFPSDKFLLVKRSIEKLGSTLTSIGRVIKNRDVYLLDGNSKKILLDRGFEHFKFKNLF
jgi:thiamine-monophosphate kinase